jgi:hypothetical protein
MRKFEGYEHRGVSQESFPEALEFHGTDVSLSEHDCTNLITIPARQITHVLQITLFEV